MMMMMMMMMITHADYVGRHGYDFRVRLFVCLSTALLRNEFKVFKLQTCYTE